MKNIAKTLVLATALSASLVAPAMADPRGHYDHYDRGYHQATYYHHHHNNGVAIGVGILAFTGLALLAASQPHYYVAPEPVYYAPAPAAYYAPAPQPVYPQPVAYEQQASDSGYCREYNTVTRINGVMTPSYGTACYQPDGSWQIVN